MRLFTTENIPGAAYEALGLVKGSVVYLSLIHI